MRTYGFEAIDELTPPLKGALITAAGIAGSETDILADKLEVSGDAALGMLAHTCLSVMRARGVEADELRSLTDSAIAYGEEPEVVAIWQGEDDGPETFGDEPGDIEEPANV